MANPKTYFICIPYDTVEIKVSLQHRIPNNVVICWKFQATQGIRNARRNEELICQGTSTNTCICYIAYIGQ